MFERPSFHSTLVFAAIGVLGAVALAARALPPAAIPNLPTTSSVVRTPSAADAAPAELPGLHNVVAFHEGFFSGSAPIGAAAFESLADLGVKTIISVDGAAPDVETASMRGMRYIHLPINYNGFDETRRRQLTRATRDAMAAGSVYLHCHHGKHRSAGAAAVIAVSLECATPEDMIKRMKVSGTSPSYPGLYRCAADATPIDAEVLDAVSPDFPSVSRPEGMVKAMVELDVVTEYLLTIDRAGWKVPADHPDLVPAAEAGRMADLLRVAEHDDDVQTQPDGFLKMWRENRDDAQRLENMIVADAPAAQLSEQLQVIIATCNECHDVYRNRPAIQDSSEDSAGDDLLSFLDDERSRGRTD